MHQQANENEEAATKKKKKEVVKKQIVKKNVVKRKLVMSDGEDKEAQQKKENHEQNSPIPTFIEMDDVQVIKPIDFKEFPRERINFNVYDI